MARLSDSVPPLVKTISEGRTPTKAATSPQPIPPAPCRLPRPVQTAGIAMLVHARDHGLDHFWMSDGRGVGVEVDRFSMGHGVDSSALAQVKSTGFLWSTV